MFEVRSGAATGERPHDWAYGAGTRPCGLGKDLERSESPPLQLRGLFLRRKARLSRRRSPSVCRQTQQLKLMHKGPLGCCTRLRRVRSGGGNCHSSPANTRQGTLPAACHISRSLSKCSAKSCRVSSATMRL